MGQDFRSLGCLVKRPTHSEWEGFTQISDSDEKRGVPVRWLTPEQPLQPSSPPPRSSGCALNHVLHVGQSRSPR
ncbi:hypothetical protein VZT92_011641 [Zoarces viviparus]|uniref:Uncharacterized protein n=1 Tax=Zoarces viviparus TaxID=48416 RepID=A0AAW1F6X0_ZOAVI